MALPWPSFSVCCHVLVELWLLEAITTLSVSAAKADCDLGNQTSVFVRNTLFKSGLCVDGGGRWGELKK